jgi:phage terminase large subunit-like protein
LSFEGLEWSIRRLTERYKVEAVLYDPASFMRSAELLAQSGIPMLATPQTPIRYAEATATLWRLISAGLIVHDGDEDLRREVLAGQTKETEQGWRLVATEQTRALIALALAVHQASAQMDTPSYWAL